MNRLNPKRGSISKRLEAKSTDWASFVSQHAFWVFFVFSAMTLASILLVQDLEIRSDFVELLPQDRQSVIDLRKTQEKVGGLGNLSIALESSNIKASQRLADDIANLLVTKFKKRIRRVDYRVDSIKKFYRDHAPLYLPLEDLKEIHHRLKANITAQRKKHNPLFMDFDDREQVEEEFDFSEFEAKLKEQDQIFEKYIDGYLTGEEGRLLVLMVKPMGSNTDFDIIRSLITDLEHEIFKLNPKSYAPDMRSNFAGNYKIALEEFDALKHDIFGTALLCLLLVGLVIWLFFRSARSLLFLGVTILSSVLWTFALTRLTVGYINTVTAFLGAIIAGSGINYGIILLARYFEERGRGTPCTPALQQAMSKTLLATMGAAATTAFSFGVFLFSEVKSLSQFGLIGGMGILLSWIFTYSLMPALMVIVDKFFPNASIKQKANTNFFSGRFGPRRFFSFMLRFPKPVLFTSMSGALIGVVLFSIYLPDSLEYNMSNLRTKSNQDSGTEKLDRRISKIFEHSMTPAFVLSKDAKHGKRICDTLLAKKRRNEDASGIETCRSVYSLLPKFQKKKLREIKRIRKLLDDRLLASLKPDQQRQLNQWRKRLPHQALTPLDLPIALQRPFLDKNGHLGSFVFVYPRSGRLLYQAENLKQFTDDIRRIELDDGEIVTASGEAVIFADLLKLLKRDGPIAMAVSFLGVFILVLFTFGTFRISGLVGMSLFFGIAWMVGLIALQETKINFFNFMALPMSFGIGVDYAINIVRRYQQEGLGSLKKVFQQSGSAVLLCSFTTVIGYGILIIADSQALASLGKLAVLGELTSLTPAMLVIPCAIVLRERRQSRTSLTANDDHERSEVHVALKHS